MGSSASSSGGSSTNEPAGIEPADATDGTGAPDGSSATGGSGANGGNGGGAPPIAVPQGDPEPDVDTEYEKVLRLSLRFYGAQRSGNTNNWLLMQYATKPGCFNADGQSIGGIDLTGGWHDAGDHIKPTLTNGYAALLMLKAYEAFPYAFVLVEGEATLQEPTPQALLPWATKIARRYVDPKRAEIYGRRNAVEGELLVRVPLTRIVAKQGVAE